MNHGRTQYAKGCRCDICREAKSQDNKRRVLKNKQHKDYRTTCCDCGAAIQPRINANAKCLACGKKDKVARELKGKKRQRLLNAKPKHIRGKGIWYVDSAGVVSRKPVSNCAWCNATYYALRKYCCRSCIEAMKRFNRRGRMKSNGNYERIDKARVLEESNNICGICQEYIDTELQHPDPMSSSIDHIIPLATGGQHNYKNVQAAHFICNSIKSDRLDYVA